MFYIVKAHLINSIIVDEHNRNVNDLLANHHQLQIGSDN